MNAEFSRTLSLLRQEKGVSQRTAAGILGISQALLSHYENGIREPGLTFVVKACDYYGVSADYLLGRTLTRDGTTIGTEELYDISDEKDNSMRGSVLALLSKKLLVNSVGMLFDLLGKTGSREAIRAASNYLSTALYKVYRHLYHANPENNPDFFSVSQRHFMAGLADADMHLSEVELSDALAAHAKAKGKMPEMDHAALARDYPVLYQSMLQLIHNSGERINQSFAAREGQGKKQSFSGILVGRHDLGAPLLEVFAGNFAACGRRVPLPMAVKEPKRHRGRLQMSTSCS